MRLSVVCVLAMAGWAAAAPGSLEKDKDTTEDLQQEEAEGDNLAPAINELERRKRGGPKSNLPYSKYRPTGGIHRFSLRRYRYPLYRKRSYKPQPSYDYEDDVILPEAAENEYFDYEDQLRGPSLFRERSLQQDRKKKVFLENDEGYFPDDYVLEKKVIPSPFIMPLKKKDSVYNLANSPYDLHTIGRMYEMGKRDDSPYDTEGLNQFHSVGRKSPPKMIVSPAEQFYDAIDSIKRKKAMFDERIMTPTEAEKLEQLLFLKSVLSPGAGQYHSGQDLSFRDPMIRRKRDTTSASAKGAHKTNTTTTQGERTESKVSAHRQKTEKLTGDRRKRAFNDYFAWERKALESEYQPVEKRSSNKDLNDFLTREYFKSIARSVGQKKKRMAYAQFEADKRSSGLNEFLENPAMLEYMQSKLREAEEEVAAEAQEELGNGNNDELLSNIVVRLDALERMREALARLEELQNKETEPPSGLSGVARKRMASSATSTRSPSPVGITALSAVSRKRSTVDDLKKNKKSALNARRISRMRREQDALPAIFLGNTREDCPVLDRVYMNCEDVTKIVGDQDQAFLGPCLRHEVCYMCGSSLSVSGHECDAILSSSLEAACSGNLDCLSAAGGTFNLLSNADRYDDDGTCTHDPCVRQFLESR
ncbi:uncharacterized protein LOC135214799 isoform X2 [Macrobrachium nipponense]|uniref:uncharacterized protein LOC135214799 isoform X2 n=1 Tax=Macrobrachium nipponense TaxID=159736 RepID=UPI0030C80538